MLTTMDLERILLEIILMFALVFKDFQIKTVLGAPILTEMDIRTKIQLVQMVLFGQ
jgi:hypothetical protein